MTERDTSNSSADRFAWSEVAAVVCCAPLAAARCPVCGNESVFGEWNILDLRTQACVELHCSACNSRETVQIALPDGASIFFPSERYSIVAEVINKELESIAALARKHADVMPVAAFTTHPLWTEAAWSATTFQWHPKSESPPIMGLVFDNEEAGLEIFREAERKINHEDRFEEIRVSIIEGAVPGQQERPGYSVHICADPDALAAHATMNELVVDPTIVPFLGQWNRHYPIPGKPLLLAKFKAEFEKHQEFMLAPTTRQADGSVYMKPELGIIKNVIHFRQLSEITEGDDPDMSALLLPQLIIPPKSHYAEGR
jgi:hypothetical protein